MDAQTHDTAAFVETWLSVPLYTLQTVYKAYYNFTTSTCVFLTSKQGLQ